MAALNKYGFSVTERQWLHEWDRGMTENAIRYAGFPEAVINDIWESTKFGLVIHDEAKRKR